MTLLALGCILIAALLHATWNFLAKRVHGGAAFIWLCDLCGLCLLAPIVLGFAIATMPTLSSQALGAICISGMLQVTYLWCLQRGYQVGDFSVVYPLARGTGSGIVVLASTLVLRESLTLPHVLGAGCIVIGIALIARRSTQTPGRHTRSAMCYSFVTGFWIASYTLWDKAAVTVIGLAPILLYYGALAVRVGVLTPLAICQWPSVQAHWQMHRRETISVALLSAISYLLILWALTFTAVSVVAPAREISILFSTLMGHRLLAEGDALCRFLGASLLVLGIIIVIGMV